VRVKVALLVSVSPPSVPVPVTVIVYETSPAASQLADTLSVKVLLKGGAPDEGEKLAVV
jgi:hypothetical protein